MTEERIDVKEVPIIEAANSWRRFHAVSLDHLLNYISKISFPQSFMAAIAVSTGLGNWQSPSPSPRPDFDVSPALAVASSDRVVTGFRVLAPQNHLELGVLLICVRINIEVQNRIAKSVSTPHVMGTMVLLIIQ